MPGTAKTTNFMLGTATVMLGPVADLYNLKPSTHSIGLVKNFTLTSEPTYVKLTQGTKNDEVYSVCTANTVRATMEAYEFTAQNLAYALGLTGAETTAAQTVTTTTSAAVDPTESPTPNLKELEVTSATGIVQDSYIMIKVDTVDNFITRRVVSVLSNTLTVDQDLPAIASGAAVIKVNKLDIGSKTEQPYYAAAITGTLADGTTITILIPKVRIEKGFNLAFATNDFGNLPIEFTVYDLVSTDTFYSTFSNSKAQLFLK